MIRPEIIDLQRGKLHWPSIKRAIRAVRKTRRIRAMRQAPDTSKCELDASARPRDLRDGLIPQLRDIASLNLTYPLKIGQNPNRK